VVDFNGDGLQDILSGSYNPGHLYVFQQQPDGKYAAGVQVLDKDGKPVLVGAAAHVSAADWDNDGDLDLVIGNIRGEVYHVANLGTAKSAAYAPAVRLKAPGGNRAASSSSLLAKLFAKTKAAVTQSAAADLQEIVVAGGDAGPSLADWDQDGLLDLVVGAGDGAVWWFRNEGNKAEPKLAAPQPLIARPARQDGSGCGTRIKVCVTDFNGDGRVDLLVGDFAYVQKKVELPPEQEAEVKKVREEYDRVVQEYVKAYQKSELPKLAAEYQKVAESDQEKAAEILKKIEEVQQQGELKEFIAKMTELQARLPDTSGNYHGFVWCFTRRTPPAGSESNP
jgi:hypothetical protein